MITIESLTAVAGEFRLENISFHVPQGTYAILMGSTGSGKTTLLESICGLRRIESGRILLGDRDVTCLRPQERGIGYVPQDGALFSTMSIADQIAFPLTIRRIAQNQVKQRVVELAELLGIEPLLNRMPQGLSGGEAQRVALARALSFRPTILVLDEPLSALDEETRHQMYSMLKRAQRHERITTLHVTHSREEAAQLGDMQFRLKHAAVIAESSSATLPVRASVSG
ncbi:MAG: ATP-binding cassette domain-containing protein [Pirellulales bacterium]